MANVMVWSALLLTIGFHLRAIARPVPLFWFFCAFFLLTYSALAFHFE